ncbi:MAG: hypothetical protein K5773_03825 [Pseudobutyrivibrio sp.]|nr:hypothetical protein [Pseudobutyrivibrio sp.]
MLGKLIKHEFQTTWRPFAICLVSLIATGLVGAFLAYIYPQNLDVPTFVSVLLGTLIGGYVLLLIAISVIAFALVVVRFYKTMFTAEGYLTFTLPVTPLQIITAKTLVSTIWILAINISTCISVGFVGLGLVIKDWDELMADLPMIMNAIRHGLEEMGAYTLGTAILFIITLLIGVIGQILTFYFAISIGQLWQQHKVLGSVLAYIVIHIIVNIITTVVSVGTSLSILAADVVNASSMEHYVSSTLWISLILNIIVCAIGYIGSIMITNKKLNLD